MPAPMPTCRLLVPIRSRTAVPGLPRLRTRRTRARSEGFGIPGPAGELRIQVATTAALLRMAIEAGLAAGVDAARADAADAEAALAAAMACPGDHPVKPLPQSFRPIYKAPPLEAYSTCPEPPAPRSLRMVPLPLRPGLLRFLPPRLGLLPAPPTPLAALLRALGMPLPSLWRDPGVFLPPAGLPWAARVARRARSGLAGASSNRHSTT